MLSLFSPWLSGSAAIHRLAGVIMLIALALVLFTSLEHSLPPWIAGSGLWVAMLLVAPGIKRTQKKQIGILILVGLAGLMFATLAGNAGSFWLKALEANQLVVGMMIGVSFLRLVALAGVNSSDALPSGVSVLQRSLFGTHLFGAVLNISAVLIVGDRLAHARHNQPLQPVQGLVLLRAFSTCAFWSPFFAAMGLALLSAPGSHLATLVLFGLPVALVALLYSAWEIKRNPEAQTAMGYPLQWSSLWMPLLLAVLVIVAHLIWPAVAVLTQVTLIALTFACSWLLLTQKVEGGRSLRRHIETGLPNMCSELALFLAAAVLAAGVAATLYTLDISLAPEHFGYKEAVLTLIALLAAAMAGMHPVTSVVLAGSLLGSSVTDPDLFGMTLLMGWALGVGLSPLSGIQLTLQARYGLSARALLRANRNYAVLMFLVCCLTLYVYQFLS